MSFSGGKQKADVVLQNKLCEFFYKIDRSMIQLKVVGKEVAVCMPTRVFSPKGLFDEWSS